MEKRQEIENLNKWHLSKYLLFTENPDNNQEIYSINLLTRTFCILSKEEFKLLFKINNPDPNSKIIIPRKFIKKQLIVNYDEYALFESLSRKNHISNVLSVTICPTLNCNFDCPYCFETHRSTKMSPETQDKIIIFLEKMVNAFNPKGIYVTWFGGEPLLGADIIESLSDKLIKFSEEKNLSYQAKIITNGYLLTQKIVDMLHEKKVNGYQITLDGLEKTHNISKHLINGEPTFNRIISNLENLKIKGTVNIRHNVYENSYEEIEELQNLIKEISKKSGNKLSYYTTPINNNELAEKRKDQIKFLDNEKREKIDILKRFKFFFKDGDTVCGAQSLSFVCIDDQGLLFKCWEDVDKPERSFGDIETWEPSNPFYTAKNLNVLTAYFNTRGALNDPECKECVWLPFCKGGCPTKRIFFQKKCVYFKNNPEEFTLAVARHFIENKYKKVTK